MKDNKANQIISQISLQETKTYLHDSIQHWDGEQKFSTNVEQKKRAAYYKEAFHSVMTTLFPEEESPESLWPDIGVSKQYTKTFDVILKEQASLLGSLTKNFVEAKVEVKVTETVIPLVEWSFIIFSSMLSDYHYRLFRVRASIMSEHVGFSVSDVTKKFLEDEGISLDASVKTTEEFGNILKRILHSPETVKIVNALLSQSGYNKN